MPDNGPTSDDEHFSSQKRPRMSNEASQYKSDLPVQKRVRMSSEPSDITVRGPDELHDEGSGSEYEADPEENAGAEQAVPATATQSSSVREAGAITKVILVQFMCHKHQVVELGPQINFVIGHNGSGKSAVLTAITLVLGAKATATNRGSSLKSFIREGQSKAEVTLHLSNRGDEAFKPEIYGDEIIIERSISKEGGGTYKIKSSRDHRVHGHTRDALQSILDHFMIQADNPLTVLNQDAAKKFLNSSNSKEKYEFFIKATQLQQLTDEYEEINNNLRTSQSLLAKKKEDLAELNKRAKSAQKTMKEVKDASKARGKIDQLQYELAWIYVSEAESEKQQAAEQLQNEELMLPKYSAKVRETEAKLAKLEEDISAIEAEQASRDGDGLEARRLVLNEKLRQQGGQMKALNAELRDADVTLKKIDGQIAQQHVLIEDENSRTLQNTDSSRQQTLTQVAELGREIKDLEKKLSEIEQGIRETNEKGKAASERSKHLKGNETSLNQEIKRVENAIRDCQLAQKNRLFAFGSSADRLKHAIDAERSWSEKPLGPLGMYVRVKDGRWSTVIESVIGNSLNAYFVSSKGDEKLLRQLMQRNNCNSTIILSTRDLFDYSSGEPAPEHLTILRALHFEDEVVKRVLINEARIERAILVQGREQGDPIMTLAAHLRPNIEACYTHDCYRVGERFSKAGSLGQHPVNVYRGPPRLSVDDGSFISERRKELEELQRRKADIAASLLECRKFDSQLRNLKAEERKLDDKLRKLREKKASLEDELNQNASSNLAALEDLKRELEAEKQTAYDQAKELVRQKDQLAAEIAALTGERNTVLAELQDRQQEERTLNEKHARKVDERVPLGRTLQHYRDSLQNQHSKIAEAKKKYEEAEVRLPETIGQAKKLCKSEEVIPSTRSKKKVFADLDLLGKIVKATETRYGKSLEDIEAKCHDAMTNFLEARKQIEEQDSSLIILEKALSLRKDHWLQFRSVIAMRAKMKFINHLRKRGYIGKLIFDHDTQRLDIQVATSEHQSTQGKFKTPKTLSGGEKSFSTICLLLTLWDAINCPIRCLDEFDVFMDVANRRTAVRMMMDSAKESNDVQYVFITPNGLEALHTGPETNIIKMADPTRNDGALAAGRA